MSAAFADRWLPLAPHRGGRHARCPWVDAPSHRCRRRARPRRSLPPGRRGAVGGAHPDRQQARAHRRAPPPPPGPLAPPALIQKIAGEIYVEQLNRGNGLLGRPVEWVLYDDQSKPDVTRSLYEKLITVDKVDLIMGPYATSGILAAMGVAQRYQKMIIHHSFGMPHLATYEMHFPVAALGPEPNVTLPGMVFDGLAATKTPPKTVAIATSKFPSAQYQSNGAREVAEKRGLKVLLYLEYEFGT